MMRENDDCHCLPAYRKRSSPFTWRPQSWTSQLRESRVVTTVRHSVVAPWRRGAPSTAYSRTLSLRVLMQYPPRCRYKRMLSNVSKQTLKLVNINDKTSDDSSRGCDMKMEMSDPLGLAARLSSANSRDEWSSWRSQAGHVAIPDQSSEGASAFVYRERARIATSYTCRL